MQVLISVKNSSALAQLDFDHYIPVFPPWYSGSRCGRRRRGDYLFSSFDNLDLAAADLAFINAGGLPVEFSRPAVDVYFDFLSELITIPGFSGIVDSHRYGFSVESGRLFDVEDVARKTARIVMAVFYTNQLLTFANKSHSEIQRISHDKKELTKPAFKKTSDS